MNHSNINFLLESDTRTRSRNHRRIHRRKRNRRLALGYLGIFVLVLAIPLWLLTSSDSQANVNIPELEQNAQSMRVEFNRLQDTDENLQEREKILKNIIANSRGTEEAELAYWDLSDLYLDSYQEPKTDLAIATLEEFLKNYPDSNWTTHFKLKLLDLYGNDNPKRASLKKQLTNDKSLPSSLRSSIN